MPTNEYIEGSGLIASQLGFKNSLIARENYYELPPERGKGYIYQLHYSQGFFIALGDYILYKPSERFYHIEEMFMEIYYFQSGNVLNIEEGKKTHKIKTGINIYLNRKKPGKVYYKANTPIKYISIILFDKYLKNYMKTKFPKVNFHQSQAFDWKNENYNTHELTLIFLQLQHSLKSNKKNSMYYESKIGEILALIIDNHKNGNQKQRQEEKALLSDDIKYLQLVKKELDINFLNPPTMEKLCSISNMGATKLKKSFKINFGTTIYNYLRNVRMKKAIFLLSENELNIYNVAQSVGYKSSSKFSKTFKKIYGMTPSEYRNSLKFNTLPK